MRRAVRTARGGVQSGVPPLLHLTDVVSCPNPALRSNKLLGELRVVRRKPIALSEWYQLFPSTNTIVRSDMELSNTKPPGVWSFGQMPGG